MDHLLFFISDHGHLSTFILFFGGLFCGALLCIQPNMLSIKTYALITSSIFFLLFFTLIITKNKSLDSTTTLHLINHSIFLKNNISDKYTLAFHCDTLTPNINSKECWSKAITMNKKEILNLMDKPHH